MSDKCDNCNSTGGVYYPNTGTWRVKCNPGMIVGRAFTHDVCDICWGSGDKDNPGKDLSQDEVEKNND